VPLPASTQWDVASRTSEFPARLPVARPRGCAGPSPLQRRHDDEDPRAHEAARERVDREEDPDRKGVFTSGIVSEREGISLEKILFAGII
jgi:hypothetical protein